MASKRISDKQRVKADASRASSPANSARAEASSSRKPSPSPSSADSPKPQIDFHFLNFSHPSEAKTGKTRKAVRSHVTKQQHQRENAAAAAKKARSGQSSIDSDDSPTTISRPLVLRSQSSSSNRLTTLDIPRRGSQVESPDQSSPSASPAASPLSTPQPRLDPLQIYPEEWHPYIPRVIDHYFRDVANSLPDHSPGFEDRLLPFILTDPAPLHAAVLCAASHYGRAQGVRSHTIDLLQLRGMAISEINHALEDQTRALSDQLILAVAKMAAFEALFGERSTFNTHMTGLLRMVSLRGGLPALGLDGLLERILLWIDSNASHITGSHIYFDKAAFPTSAVHPPPDPIKFAGGLV